MNKTDVGTAPHLYVRGGNLTNHSECFTTNHKNQRTFLLWTEMTLEHKVLNHFQSICKKSILRVKMHVRVQASPLSQTCI